GRRRIVKEDVAGTAVDDLPVAEIETGDGACGDQMDRRPVEMHQVTVAEPNGLAAAGDGLRIRKTRLADDAVAAGLGVTGDLVVGRARRGIAVEEAAVGDGIL